MRVGTTLLLCLFSLLTVTAAVNVSNGFGIVTDTVVYGTAYYTTDGTTWQQLSLNGDTQRGAWYITRATAPVPEGATALATYSCAWNNGWDCHGNDWQITTLSSNDTAQNTTIDGLAWSDPATWPSGEVPSPGDTVTITNDMNVVLDQSTTVEGIDIQGGNLTFARKDLELTTDYIRVMDRGTLRIGTQANPFEHKAIITLKGTRSEQNTFDHCGYKTICSIGGKLDLHGAVRGPTWTQLENTAHAGADTIVVEEPVQWQAGDEIVIVSSSFDPGLAERRTIAAVQDSTITLNQSLKFQHWGEMQHFGSNNEYKLDERAEVMHLTRNIVIQGDEQSSNDNFGGHVMTMNEHHMEQMRRNERDGDEYIDMFEEYDNDLNLVPTVHGVEFNRMGQTGILARYPFHWHLYGNASGSTFLNNSIHNSFQRCVTLHSVQNVLLENNVAYNAIGHCYFLEDGLEYNNVLRNNIGALIRPFPDESRQLIPSDRFPSVYWWSNSQNDFIGNVAAGAYGFGFWLEPKPYPDGPSSTRDISLQRPNGHRNPNVHFGRYEDNVVHSTVSPGRLAGNSERPDLSGDGFFIGDGRPVFPNFQVGEELGDGPDFFNFYCGVGSGDAERGRGQECLINNLTAYYNDGFGFIVHNDGSQVNLVNSTLADNDAEFFSDISREEGLVMVGASANRGNPGQAGNGWGEYEFNFNSMTPSEFRDKESTVNKSLPFTWSVSLFDGSGTLPRGGYSWKYDGGMGRDIALINYHDTKYFDRGGVFIPGNSQHVMMWNTTLINSDPYLPQGDSNRIFIRDLDGSLTGTGTYTEIREWDVPEGADPRAFFDDTCETTKYGDHVQYCTSRSAFISKSIEIIGADAYTVTRESDGANLDFVGTGTIFNETYHYDIPIGSYGIRITLGEGDNDDWIVLTLPNDVAMNAESASGGYRWQPEDVQVVSSEQELYQAGELITLYYDATNQRQYIKLRPKGEIRTDWWYSGQESPWQQYQVSLTP